MKTDARPTLLIFARASGEEAAKKRLLPRRFRRLEHELHSRGLREAIAAGRRTGCRVLVATLGPISLPGTVERLEQTGARPVERFAAAVRAASELSSGPLLVTGIDTPGLGEEHLQEALEALRSAPDRAVVGPSTDGGFYLVGCWPVGGEPFPSIASDLGWGSDTAVVELVAALEASGRRVTALESLSDLDTRADLRRWLEKAQAPFWLELGRRLAEAAAAITGRVAPPVLGEVSSAALLGGSGNRAPPRRLTHRP